MDPFIYQYVIGGAVFGVGLLFAARQGYVGLSGRPLRNLLFLIGGLAAFGGLQGYLQYAPMPTADPVPYDGSLPDKATLGTRLDYAIVVGYFLAILLVGTCFGRRQITTRDFFFAGQRFSWWLIAFSLVATTVGSYSFVKYSRVGFDYGLSSTQTYLNDWFWVPLLIFGWLPILYFSRITSIPEYFERRFGRSVRVWASALILVYLVGYVGVNLFTMGKVLNQLLGWEVLAAAALVAGVSAAYVTVGGQTSVIMTDLFQGVMLLAVGFLLLMLGIDHLGGFDLFWRHLPERRAFAPFNRDPSFSAVGIFWQDAMANTAMFYFLNQGMVMRFMAARSVNEARKAAMFMPLVLMPLAACVVASGGWVARALVHSGSLPGDVASDRAFFIAAEFLSRPGVFGLIVAALTAALMSTLDTLITAVSAVAVNDFYKVYIRPHASEREQLRAARVCAVSVSLLGIALVPIFAKFKTIYAAHGAFTASVTPPLVITLLASVFWRRFTRQAALWTLAGGIAAMVFSLFVPQVIAPFAQGVPMADAGDDFFAGMRQYKFMRACYGLAVCATIAIVVTLLTRPEPVERQRGLVWSSVSDAVCGYKGSAGRDGSATRARALPRQVDGLGTHGATGFGLVRISGALAERLGGARAGDLLHVSDGRAWLGGLRSAHAIVDAVLDDEAAAWIALSEPTWSEVVSRRRAGREVLVERLYG